jgi:hypothetical protein
MIRHFIFALVFCIFVPCAQAQAVVAPSDLEDVLKKIAGRQPAVDPSSAVRIVFQGERIAFEGQPVDVDFDSQKGTLSKHFRLKKAKEDYGFSAVLQSSKEYDRVIRQVGGIDALIFFNDEEVFVYTQTLSAGRLAFQEWIYARKPNGPRGSQWSWVLKADAWHWPITMEAGEDGVTRVNRHLPFAGIPIDQKARHNYMLQMMLKFKSGDYVKKYFPFSESVASIPPVRFWNREGIERQANVGVMNTSVVDPDKPKPEHGLDFNAWNDYWQSVYTIAVSAPPQEYPLLIGSE